MRVNTAPQALQTHEGAKAKHISNLEQLRRSVLACLLWEDQFYENGDTIAERIREGCHRVQAIDVAMLALEARTRFKLRHVPLLLARELCRHEGRNTVKVGITIADVIQRADELAEFLAIYWMDGKQPLSKQAKVGLARAFTKFDAYQLAKYDRAGAIRLRDVLFLCHAKPKDKAQAETWKRLVDGTLKAPDTWEVNLSGGADKKDTFERLLSENKLGYMALLRNLRNMEESGVDRAAVKQAILNGAKHSKALPFRYLSAAKHAPGYVSELDVAMQTSMRHMDKLPGRTVVCVDVSGSMSSRVSGRSEMNREGAASAVAILARGICEDCRVIAFGTEAAEIPGYQGLALADRLSGYGSVVGHGTNVRGAVALAGSLGYDRIIVITDEQSATKCQDPEGVGYMINVASYENGIGYGAWTHIDGFSEAVVQYIQEIEGS